MAGTRVRIGIDRLVQDVRHGGRAVRRHPGFALAAIATLGFGIGASTAIFSVVYGFLWRPLPLAEVDRLVAPLARQGDSLVLTSARDVMAWRQGRSFTQVGTALVESVNLAGEPYPERVQAARLTPDYLATLGIQPAFGRAFDSDDAVGHARVALIGYGLWQRRFGGAPIIGQTMLIDEQAHVIVGVLPRRVDLPLRTELWRPLSIEALPNDQLGVRQLMTVARLGAGVTAPQVQDELDAINARLQREFPDLYLGWDATFVTMRQALASDFRGDTRSGLLAVQAAVLFLLFIGALNVANLLLMRGFDRRHEVAVRMALGASRAQLVRHSFVETAWIVGIGGGVGWLMALWMASLIARWLPLEPIALADELQEVRFDARVLGFTLLVCAATALVAGLAPAVRAGGLDLARFLKRRTHTAGGRMLTRTFVVVQVAVSLTLLAGAGLMVQTFQHLHRLELGFRPEQRVSVELNLSSDRYRDHARRVAFVDEVLDRVRALPGIHMAAASTDLPLAHDVWDAPFECEGRQPASPAEVLITSDRHVTVGYLETIGVTLLRGRLFDARDHADAQPVVVVSQTLASACFRGAEPLGRRVRRRSRVLPAPWMTIVGVVADVREDRGTFRDDRPVWYIPYAQMPTSAPRPMHLVVRAALEPAAIGSAVRDAVWAVDRRQPVAEVRTLDALVDDVTATQRFSAWLTAVVGGAGLLLAAVGLFGAIATSVRRRSKEIGIRIAIGATRAHVLSQVLRESAMLVAIGLAVGVVAMLMLARLLDRYVFGVTPHDPATLASAAAVLLAGACIACAIPARRATRVDPMVTLRDE